MKSAILLIFLYQGGMTSQLVPASQCEYMAKQAVMIEQSLIGNKTQVRCIYGDRK